MTGPSDNAGEHRAPMRCLAILNTAAGSYLDAESELEDLGPRLERTGLSVTERRVAPEDLTATLEHELTDEPTLVIAGGGDGTVQAVARRLRGGPHTLGVLPLGTMNRFCKTLGIPQNVDEALEVIVEGRDQPVDLAEANGRLFLRTCVVGVYPELARRREQRRRRHRRWPNLIRWLVDTLSAAFFVLHHWPRLRFRLAVDGEPLDGYLSTLLVTNNATAPLGPHTVATSDLGLFIPRAATPAQLFWLTLRAILFGPERPEPLEVRTIDNAVLSLPAHVPVALDAEVTPLSPPLELRVRREAVWIRSAVTPERGRI